MGFEKRTSAAKAVKRRPFMARLKPVPFVKCSYVPGKCSPQLKAVPFVRQSFPQSPRGQLRLVFAVNRNKTIRALANSPAPDVC
jgi:hypothetical protein